MRSLDRLSPFLHYFTAPLNSLIFHACANATSLPSVAPCIQFVPLMPTDYGFWDDILRKQPVSLPEQGLSIVSVQTISVYFEDKAVG